MLRDPALSHQPLIFLVGSVGGMRWDGHINSEESIWVEHHIIHLSMCVGDGGNEVERMKRESKEYG